MAENEFGRRQAAGGEDYAHFWTNRSSTAPHCTTQTSQISAILMSQWSGGTCAPLPWLRR